MPMLFFLETAAGVGPMGMGYDITGPIQYCLHYCATPALILGLASGLVQAGG